MLGSVCTTWITWSSPVDVSTVAGSGRLDFRGSRGQLLVALGLLDEPTSPAERLGQALVPASERPSTAIGPIVARSWSDETVIRAQVQFSHAPDGPVQGESRRNRLPAEARRRRTPIPLARCNTPTNPRRPIIRARSTAKPVHDSRRSVDRPVFSANVMPVVSTTDQLRGRQSVNATFR